MIFFLSHTLFFSFEDIVSNHLYHPIFVMIFYMIFPYLYWISILYYLHKFKTTLRISNHLKIHLYKTFNRQITTPTKPLLGKQLLGQYHNNRNITIFTDFDEKAYLSVNMTIESLTRKI